MRNGSARWFCYLLACADGTLYAGITNSLDRRVAAHNAGSASKYTRARRPVALAWWRPCRDRAEASRREAALKALPRSAKLALTRARPATPRTPRAGARARGARSRQDRNDTGRAARAGVAAAPAPPPPARPPPR